jgi:hypothetical protein
MNADWSNHCLGSGSRTLKLPQAGGIIRADWGHQWILGTHKSGETYEEQFVAATSSTAAC